VQLPESEIEAIDSLPKLEELKSSGDTDIKVNDDATAITA
jgi:hypothetical protein